MKLKTTDFENAVSYRTLFASAAHVSEEMRAVLLAMADNPDCYYCHRTTQKDDAGIILRFKAIAGDEWEDVEDELQMCGIESELLGLIEHIANADFDAVHFDVDFDLIAFAHWYTDDQQKVIPLAYDVWIEMDKNDNYYFDLNGTKHYIDDFLRLDDNSEMKSYGYSACCGESNTSSLFIELSDDSDRVDVVRVV